VETLTISGEVGDCPCVADRSALIHEQTDVFNGHRPGPLAESPAGGPETITWMSSRVV